MNYYWADNSKNFLNINYNFGMQSPIDFRNTNELVSYVNILKHVLFM